MSKILIAEDETDISFIIETVLKKIGHVVMTAFDGETALAKATAEKPDLILLDIMMPKMDGFTINSRLKENPKTKDIKVLIMTAKGGMKGLFDLGKRYSVNGYMEKPFQVNMLLDKIKEVLEEKN
ncbi:MAG: response regulator [Candidatus Firestonebacteria bacterium]